VGGLREEHRTEAPQEKEEEEIKMVRTVKKVRAGTRGAPKKRKSRGRGQERGVPDASASYVSEYERTTAQLNYIIQMMEHHFPLPPD
jgi:hypothetical protein